jgi:hypothetical protein
MHAAYEFLASIHPQTGRVLLGVIGVWMMVGFALFLATRTR